jgi:hypothetical protein
VICALYLLVKGCQYSLIIIEGVSQWLFLCEEPELVKEFEAVVKRLSQLATIVTTCTINANGNIIGHYLWNNAVNNTLSLAKYENMIQVTWCKYTVRRMNIRFT